MSEHTPLPWIICESDLDPGTLLIAHPEHGTKRSQQESA